jgi:hypothetical protein
MCFKTHDIKFGPSLISEGPNFLLVRGQNFASGDQIYFSGGENTVIKTMFNLNHIKDKKLYFIAINLFVLRI